MARLVEACAKTCRTSYVLRFGFDDDDPALAANITAAHGHQPVSGPRMGLAHWTNYLASLYAIRPPAYFASLGDDHVPMTDGWDERLVTAVEHMGGGFAYPNDLRRSDVPEAVVISAPVVAALGWMCLPALDHWYVDNVWRDLGAGAGCLTYCRDVVVQHLHPLVTGQPSDQTYDDAARSFDADLATYQRWRLRTSGMTSDIKTVREVTRS